MTGAFKHGKNKGGFRGVFIKITRLQKGLQCHNLFELVPAEDTVGKGK